MATKFYQRFWERILAKQIDVASDAIKCLLVDTTYTFDQDHDYVSDVVSAEVSGTGYTGGFSGSGRIALASKVVTLDDTNDLVSFDAADVTWSGINLGATQIGGLILWVPKTNDSDSPLLLHTDEGGFPVTTSGGDYIHSWNSSGIFQFLHP